MLRVARAHDTERVFARLGALVIRNAAQCARVAWRVATKLLPAAGCVAAKSLVRG